MYFSWNHFSFLFLSIEDFRILNCNALIMLISWYLQCPLQWIVCFHRAFPFKYQISLLTFYPIRSMLTVIFFLTLLLIHIALHRDCVYNWLRKIMNQFPPTWVCYRNKPKGYWFYKELTHYHGISRCLSYLCKQKIRYVIDDQILFLQIENIID